MCPLAGAKKLHSREVECTAIMRAWTARPRQCLCCFSRLGILHRRQNCDNVTNIYSPKKESLFSVARCSSYPCFSSLCHYVRRCCACTARAFAPSATPIQVNSACPSCALPLAEPLPHTTSRQDCAFSTRTRIRSSCGALHVLTCATCVGTESHQPTASSVIERIPPQRVDAEQQQQWHRDNGSIIEPV